MAMTPFIVGLEFIKAFSFGTYNIYYNFQRMTTQCRCSQALTL